MVDVDLVSERAQWSARPRFYVAPTLHSDRGKSKSVFFIGLEIQLHWTVISLAKTIQFLAIVCCQSVFKMSETEILNLNSFNQIFFESWGGVIFDKSGRQRLVDKRNLLVLTSQVRQKVTR